MKPEELLRKLLDEYFYVSNCANGLMPLHVSPKTIAEEMGLDFEIELLPYLKDEDREELKRRHNRKLNK